MPRPGHKLGLRKLNMEFRRLPEKHEKACQYAVLVEGVEIGTLYREYEEGARIAYGCVGGSYRGGFGWHLDECESLQKHLERHNETLWLATNWDTRDKAKVALIELLDRPMDLGRGGMEERWWRKRVLVFLDWLDARMPQETSLRAV